jgi:hypothetical protein
MRRQYEITLMDKARQVTDTSHVTASLPSKARGARSFCDNPRTAGVDKGEDPIRRKYRVSRCAACQRVSGDSISWARRCLDALGLDETIGGRTCIYKLYASLNTQQIRTTHVENPFDDFNAEVVFDAKDRS